MIESDWKYTHLCPLIIENPNGRYHWFLMSQFSQLLSSEAKQAGKILLAALSHYLTEDIVKATYRRTVDKH